MVRSWGKDCFLCLVDKSCLVRFNVFGLTVWCGISFCLCFGGWCVKSLSLWYLVGSKCHVVCAQRAQKFDFLVPVGEHHRFPSSVFQFGPEVQADHHLEKTTQKGPTWSASAKAQCRSWNLTGGPMPRKTRWYSEEDRRNFLTKLGEWFWRSRMLNK